MVCLPQALYTLYEIGVHMSKFIRLFPLSTYSLHCVSYTSVKLFYSQTYHWDALWLFHTSWAVIPTHGTVREQLWHFNPNVS